MKAFTIALASMIAVVAAAPPNIALADPPRHARERGYNPHDNGRHDNGRHRGWDRHRYNGYIYRGEWRYGPPPRSVAPYVDYGWRDWRRGDRLPSYYRNYYPVVDYRAYRLAPPPRGCHYVRDDRGDYLLVGIATGVILGVILANN